MSYTVNRADVVMVVVLDWCHQKQTNGTAERSRVWIA